MDLDLVSALGLTNQQLGPVGSFAKSVVAPGQLVRMGDGSVIETSKSKDAMSAVAGTLVGVGIGTAAAAAIGYGLGSWMYPQIGGAPFAKVSAVGYVVPVGIFLGLAAVGVLGDKKTA